MKNYSLTIWNIYKIIYIYTLVVIKYFYFKSNYQYGRRLFLHLSMQRLRTVKNFLIVATLPCLCILFYSNASFSMNGNEEERQPLLGSTSTTSTTISSSSEVSNGYHSYPPYPQPQSTSPELSVAESGAACGFGSGALGYCMFGFMNPSISSSVGTAGCVLSAVAGACVGAGCSLACYLCGDQRWMGWEEHNTSSSISTRGEGNTTTYGSIGTHQHGGADDPGEGPSRGLPPVIVHQSGDSGSPVVSQPRGSGSPVVSQPGGSGQSSSYLTAEASLLGQMSSLHSMQCLLSNGSEQVLTTLRMLLLKKYSDRSKTQDLPFLQKNYISKDGGKVVSVKRKRSSSSTTIDVPSFLPYRFFSSIKPQGIHVERKACSGQIGVFLDLSPDLTCGFAYDSNKKESKEYKGIQLGSTIGSVKSKMETEGLSAIVALNPVNTGVTGHLVSSYNWGKVKNTRKIIHNGQEIIIKGSPEINLLGGLVQLGYNFLLSNQVTLVPYVECMFSSVSWSSYKEKHASGACKFGENKEQIVEKSIGLRSDIGISTKSSMQFWIAGVSGYNKTNSLTSSSYLSSYCRYNLSTYAKKSQYIRTELGVSYDGILSDNISVSLSGFFRLNKRSNVDNQNITAQLKYTY